MCVHCVLWWPPECTADAVAAGTVVGVELFIYKQGHTAEGRCTTRQHGIPGSWHLFTVKVSRREGVIGLEADMTPLLISLFATTRIGNYAANTRN